MFTETRGGNAPRSGIFPAVTGLIPTRARNRAQGTNGTPMASGASNGRASMRRRRMHIAFGWVERSEPGRGAAAAITLGLATLILPFATVLFSHVLSTTLGFAAFYLLWRQRDRGGGVGWIAAAGFLAGYAVSTEYPLGLLAVLLAVYVAWRRSPVKPLIAYGTGFVIGLIPLLLYDWWAFGAPLHLSYSYVAANSSGVLGFGAPSLRSAIKLLVSDRGLLVVTPVVAAGVAGSVILYREGRRLDA